MDYDYIKNHYILIAVDLSRQKKVDADPKVIQQIEFVGKFENNDGVLTVLEKVKRHINILSRKCHCLIKDENSEEARVFLTNTYLRKLKSAGKRKTGTTLRITKKNYQDEELPHELFLATR